MQGAESFLPSGVDAAVYGGMGQDVGGGLVASALLDAGAIPSFMEWKSTLRFNDVIAQMPTEVLSISLDVRLNAVKLSSPADLSFITSLLVYLRPAPNPADTTRASQTDCWSQISANPVASYTSQLDPSGPTINLVNLVPEVNLFTCLKTAPADFVVAMQMEPLAYPMGDVPLTLSTCVGARTTASYP